MPVNFFATTEIARLFPFEGDQEYWIDVQQELTAGDEHAMFQAASRTTSMDGGRTVVNELDLDRGAFTKVATWLHDWNLANGSGQTIDIRRSKQAKLDALRNLKPEYFRAITQAIDAHAAARSEEKKLRSTPPSASNASENSPSAAG